MINDVLRDFLPRFLISNIDDILIYSLDLESHVENVRFSIQKLLNNQLYVEAETCGFHKIKISFLGYNIDTARVSMDQKKEHAVLQWLWNQPFHWLENVYICTWIREIHMFDLFESSFCFQKNYCFVVVQVLWNLCVVGMCVRVCSVLF